jgi:hypothetical protein
LAVSAFWIATVIVVLLGFPVRMFGRWLQRRARKLERHGEDDAPVNRDNPIRADASESSYTVEGFFGNLKTGIRANYKKVSHKWLQGYL